MDPRDRGGKIKASKNNAGKNQNKDDGGGDKRQGNESRTS